MADFFPGLDEYMADKQAQAEQSYDATVLKQLLTALAGSDKAKELQLEANDAFGFVWFNQLNWLPIKLRTAKIRVPPIHLIRGKGFTKTELWQTYFSIKAEYPDAAAVGMIFQVVNGGRYVMHNDTRLPLMAGYNSVVRHASKADKALYIVPWAAFIYALQLMGTDGIP